MTKTRDHIMVLETSPSILDLVDWDYVKEEYPEVIASWCEKHGKKREGLLENDRDELIIDEFGDDSFLYEQRWEDDVEYLQELLDTQVQFKSGSTLRCVVSPGNWRGQEGYRTFEYNDSALSLIHDTFAKLDVDFIARIVVARRGRLEALVSCHDIPTGSHVVITRNK